MSREERWQRRLALPVLVAALASVPAMFLAFVGGPLGTAGRWVDLLSGAVLVGEAVVLFAVAEHKRAWIRGHVGLLLLTLAVAVAVVLAVGPVQVLRLVRAVGALRVLRAGRIVRAARELRDRLGWTGRASSVFAVAAGLLAAVFVGVVLADPTSRSRSLLTWAVGPVSTPVVVVLSVVAGLLLGGATYLLARDSGLGDEEPADTET
ncbi:hypothetical protein [uncultured Modestobacter sp.]|uniref:hypothetical protein n=1 Tax=uncultured Modestobacter sp. TaxID=380048 RepID=UPI00261677FC|nr:hypothetical protein [uncultured Modestobacter sp.]